MTEINLHTSKKQIIKANTALKALLHNCVEPAIILGIIGALSGFIIFSLAAFGYLSLPGLGPMIAISTFVTAIIGMVAGAFSGCAIGLIFGVIASFINITSLRHNG